MNILLSWISLLCRPDLMARRVGRKLPPLNHWRTWFGVGWLFVSAAAPGASFVSFLGAESGRIYAVGGDGSLQFFRHQLDQGLTVWANQGVGQVIGGPGWREYRHLAYGGEGILYAVSASGRLYYYRDLARNGTPDWENGGISVEIGLGQGWADYRWLLGDGDGVLYAVSHEGTLWYYRHLSQAATPVWDNGGQGKVVAEGFQRFRSVFTGRNGVIYGILPNGDLYYFRDAARDGTGNLQPDSAGLMIGNGWNRFAHVFSTGGGDLYGVEPDGDVFYYHVEVAGREVRWTVGGASVRSGWASVACPLVQCPGDMTVKCQGPDGARVTFIVTGTNACSSAPVQVECVPPSGSLFPVGITVVRCTARSEGLVDACEFRVTVECDESRPPVAGRITTTEGDPFPGVEVQLSGVTNRTARTDAAGSFAFADLPPGDRWVLRPAWDGFTFNPSEFTVTRSNRLGRADFVVQTPLEKWRQQYWTNDTPASVKGLDADPDGDGLPNLLEYAFGYNPTVPKAQQPLRVRVDTRANGELELVFDLDTVSLVPDLRLHLESTPNLAAGQWTGVTNRATPANNPCPAGLCEGFRIPLPRFNRHQFYRLRLESVVPVDTVTGRSRRRTDPAADESLRVGTYNVQMLHPVAELGTDPCCDEIPDRTRRITDRIKEAGFDVIALNEAYRNGENPCDVAPLRVLAALVLGPDSSDLAQLLTLLDLSEDLCELGYGYLPTAWDDAKGDFVRALAAEMAPEFPHYVRFLDLSPSFDDSGLMLFSKLPFVPLPAGVPAKYFPADSDLKAVRAGAEVRSADRYVAFTAFEEAKESDKWSAKGAGLVRMVNERTGRPFIVVFTHLQANEDDVHPDTRAAQLRQISTLVEDVLNALPPDERSRQHVLILGDLNVNGDLTRPTDATGAPHPHYVEWKTHFDTAGSWYTDRVHDAWAAQSNPSVVPMEYVDAGGTQGFLNSDGYVKRLDYLLLNRPANPVRNQPLAVQHMARAFALRDTPPFSPMAFGEAGGQDLSDHFGIIADLNILETACHPQTAHRPMLRDSDPRETSLDGELLHPGSMQWYRFDLQGTYTFAVRAQEGADDGFAADVFESRELSVPIAPYLPEGRILDSPRGQALGRVYKSGKSPLFVRVSPKTRSGQGKYWLIVKRHQGFTPEDAVGLGPDDDPTAIDPVDGASGITDRWFFVRTERATTGRPQRLKILKTDAAGFSLHHQLTLLDARGVPYFNREEVGSQAVELMIPGGGVYRLRVHSFGDTARAGYTVAWEGELTAVFGSGECPLRLKAETITDNEFLCIPLTDICLELERDDNVRLSLNILQDRGAEGILRTEVPLLRSGDGVLVEDWKENRAVGLGGIMPDIRLLPDERLEIRLTEEDGGGRGNDDVLLGYVDALTGRQRGEACLQVPVLEQPQSGEITRGRYGWQGVRSRSTGVVP
jgi:endonuclease/exonuclease/phosphatase family metal-dependent hydrolase